MASGFCWDFYKTETASEIIPQKSTNQPMYSIVMSVDAAGGVVSYAHVPAVVVWAQALGGLIMLPGRKDVPVTASMAKG